MVSLVIKGQAFGLIAMKYSLLSNKVSFILTPLPPSPPWGRVQVDRALVEGVNGGPHIIVKNHETHSTESSKLVNNKPNPLTFITIVVSTILFSFLFSPFSNTGVCYDL